MSGGGSCCRRRPHLSPCGVTTITALPPFYKTTDIRLRASVSSSYLLSSWDSIVVISVGTIFVPKYNGIWRTHYRPSSTPSPVISRSCHCFYLHCCRSSRCRRHVCSFIYFLFVCACSEEVHTRYKEILQAEYDAVVQQCVEHVQRFKVRRMPSGGRETRSNLSRISKSPRIDAKTRGTA